MSYNDPTVLHSAECQRCGTVYRDGDVLDAYGYCPSCVEECGEIMDAEDEF
jgi:predicted Zn-ribbon and HTH transcriptional regulator